MGKILANYLVTGIIMFVILGLVRLAYDAGFRFDDCWMVLLIAAVGVSMMLYFTSPR